MNIVLARSLRMGCFLDWKALNVEGTRGGGGGGGLYSSALG